MSSFKVFNYYDSSLQVFIRFVVFSFWDSSNSIPGWFNFFRRNWDCNWDCWCCQRENYKQLITNWVFNVHSSSYQCLLRYIFRCKFLTSSTPPPIFKSDLMLYIQYECMFHRIEYSENIFHYLLLGNSNFRTSFAWMRLFQKIQNQHQTQSPHICLVLPIHPQLPTKWEHNRLRVCRIFSFRSNIVKVECAMYSQFVE